MYKIDYNYLALNTNPLAISLLDKYLSSTTSNDVIWIYLGLKPHLINLIEKYIDKISWFYLALNPYAIHILEQNFNKINWTYLSVNEKAIHILENNIPQLKPHFGLTKFQEIGIIKT